MSATKEVIRKWIQEAPPNTRWVLVILDTFDGECYPVYFDFDNPKAVLDRIVYLKEESVDRLMECYDLTLNIDSQLSELRANHLPKQESIPAMYPTQDPQPIDQTLAERGTRYGVFADHAVISQGIKDVMYDAKNWHKLAPDQKECLEMIAHKIGRILNGDPDYHDSWHDIQGYTKLVADRLVEANKS